MTFRVGSLCTGYGGLDAAVQEVLGGELAWVADNDPGKARILAHRFPQVRNLGDISEVRWDAVEPVDIACMGFPCKDVSCAGARAGLREGNRSGVWNYCAAAIDALRPPLVIIENVRGLHSAGADSNLEPCPWCMGDGGRERPLRASGAVLGDLADLGYDAEWVTVSASDAGAPHRRERVFIVARPAADADSPGEGRGELPPRRYEPGGRPAGSREAPAHAGRDRREGQRGDAGPGAVRAAAQGGGREPAGSAGPAEDADRAARGERGLAAPGQAPGWRPRADAGGPGGAPAAHATSHGRNEGRPEPAGIGGRPDAAERRDGPAAHPDGGGRGAGEHGLPARERDTEGRSPADTYGGRLTQLAERDSGTVTGIDGALRHDAERCGEAPPDPGGEGCEGQGHAGPRGRSGTAAGAPGHAESVGRRPEGQQRGLGPAEPVAGDIEWGAYEPAIRRWETVLGRPAPRPTEPGRTGERLSPRFVEWMMGLTEGWVTGVPGLSRNQQLAALGDGVVPQQAVMALRLLLGAIEAGEAA